MNPADLQSWYDLALESFLFGLAFLAIYCLLKVISTELFRWVFPFANALLLTLFTVGCSGQFPFLLEKQTVLLSGLHHFQSQLHQNQSLNAVMGDKRLLLVDVSHDLALVPDSSLNASWRSNQLITDRQKLTRFLQSLNTDSARIFVDMVVCDLTFGAFSANKSQDDSLQAAFNSLAKQNRLLVARSELEETRSVHNNSAVRTDTLPGGSVDITKYYDGTFFSYKFFDSTVGSLASLPYVLYSKLTTIPAKSGPFCAQKPPVKKRAGGLWESAVFVPDFWIDNEDISRETEPPAENSWWRSLLGWADSTPDTSLENATGKLVSSFFYLGQVTDTDTSEFGGRTAFRDQLRQNYTDCKRTIVFIGIFEDPDRDMHQTLIGPMHGSILLLNMFMNLLAGSHLIGIGYLLYLMTGFWGVGYLLIQEPYHLQKRKLSKKPGIWTAIVNYIRKTLYGIAQYIIDERAYLVAFLILLGAISFFNHLINLVIIGVYLATTKDVFELLIHEKTHNVPKEKQVRIAPEDNTEA